MANAIYFLEEDIGQKRDQINSVLALLEELESNDIFLSEMNVLLKPSSVLINTLKSSIYLMLYNAVEATMRECIVIIHDELDLSLTSFDDLRYELKKEILQRIKKEDKKIDDLISENCNPISKSIHKTTFEKTKIFSGNIDRDEIKKISKVYGFDTDSDYSITSHGDTLTDIKKKRNDLAHGNIDFGNAAKLETVGDLKIKAEKTINYLESIVGNIEKYIDDESYFE